MTITVKKRTHPIKSGIICHLHVLIKRKDLQNFLFNAIYKSITFFIYYYHILVYMYSMNIIAKAINIINLLGTRSRFFLIYTIQII